MFLHLVLKTTDMVGQGMNDFLSLFNECSLKKERSDTAREDHAAFRKLCISTAIG